MLRSDEKFCEILERHQIPVDLESQTVAMHRSGSGSGERVTFYGVGSSIPPEIVAEIEAEVFPLLALEQGPSFKCIYAISKEVLCAGAPAMKQDAWNLHCRLSDPDGNW